MALVLADRVQETTVTTGTGTVTLTGAVTGYQSFAAIGNGNTTYYCIQGQTTAEWEVGLGTYTASGTTLARTTVLASSNAGSAVNFSAGTKNVFCTYPAARSVAVNGTTIQVTNSATLPIANGGTGAATQAAAITALAGAQTSGYYLRSDGTNTVLAGIQAADVPTLNQNTSGSAASLSANLPVTRLNSGTSASSSTFWRGDGTWAAAGANPAGSSGQVQYNSGGSFAGSANMTFDGTNLTVGGSVTANSDETLKTNWRGLPADFVERLAGVKHGTYDRVDTELTQDGVSAQSLQKLLPNSVLQNEDGKLSVAYGNAALVAAIALAERVVQLEAIVAKLTEGK